MVIKTEQCAYTEYKIYPGRGQRFIAKDGKTHFFFTSKVASLFQQRIKPVKLRWTQAWRRMNKKGNTDSTGKRKIRRVQKFQKAIVGMSLEDIKKKKAQKPELRREAKEAAAREAKQRQQKKGASGAKAAAPKPAGKKQEKATKQAAAPKAPQQKGKR
jgi:large subunit ribosomal protein L24e